MEEQKRFQNQTLNSDDYGKTEEGVKAIKNGGKFLAGLAVCFGVAKRYGPAFLKNISRIKKL